MAILKLVSDTIHAAPDLPHRAELQMICAGAWSVVHTLYPSNVGADMEGRIALAARTELGINIDWIDEILNWLPLNYHSSLVPGWRASRATAERWL